MRVLLCLLLLSVACQVWLGSGGLIDLVDNLNANRTFKWSRLASNLNNPRHLAFGKGDDRNHLYIAEAGIGSNKSVPDSEACILGEQGTMQCHGSSGSITRVDMITLAQDRIVDDLPSLADAVMNDTDTSAMNGAFAYGPSAVSTLDAYCPSRSFVDFDIGDISDEVGLPSNSESANKVSPLLFASMACTGADALKNLSDAGAKVEEFGKIFQLFHQFDETFVRKEVADPCKFINSLGLKGNPTDILSLRHHSNGDIYHVVADASGDRVLACEQDDGECRVIAVIEPRKQKVSDLGDQEFTIHSVPTSLTYMDGNMMVGELTGFPYVPNFARVLKLDAAAALGQSVFKESFTNIVDLTHDRDGNLYVLEMLTKGLRVGINEGDVRSGLVKIAADGTRTRLLPCAQDDTECEDLAFAFGIVYRHGSLFVTQKSVFPGIGEVVELPLSGLKAVAE